MKSLILFTLMAISLLAESPVLPSHDNQGLDVEKNIAIDLEEMVVLYGYDGTLMKELLLTDVVNS